MKYTSTRKKLKQLISCIIAYTNNNETYRNRAINKPITPDTELGFFGLGFDKLDVYQLTMELEKIFNIEISDNIIQKFKTVGDIYEHIQEATKPYLTIDTIYIDIINIIKQEYPNLHDYKFSMNTGFYADLDLTMFDIAEICDMFCAKYDVKLPTSPDITTINLIGDLCVSIYNSNHNLPKPITKTQKNILKRIFQKQR